MLSFAAASFALIAFQQAKPAAPDAKPVTLNRVFAKGEKLEYSVNSNLHVEDRPYGLDTFIPEDQTLSYRFSTEVKDLKNDGGAILHYLRPSMTEVDAATFDTPAKTTVDKINMNFDLTVSPINEILDQKDLNPPKPPKKPASGDGGDGGGDRRFWIRGAVPAQGIMSSPLAPYIMELYRLSLNVGAVSSALDFSPKLPFDDVKVGDTWQHTISA
ncbi:MAG TPA: hypothetical protein VMI31_02395, partial [Fimbriimonadaceae bacterium]|nr:hypothetical protein [Fimbriimonadaceae bacterium]